MHVSKLQKIQNHYRPVAIFLILYDSSITDVAISRVTKCAAGKTIPKSRTMFVQQKIKYQLNLAIWPQLGKLLALFYFTF